MPSVVNVNSGGSQSGVLWPTSAENINWEYVLDRPIGGGGALDVTQAQGQTQGQDEAQDSAAEDPLSNTIIISGIPLLIGKIVVEISGV